MQPNENSKKTLLDLPSSIYFDRPNTVESLVKKLKEDFFVSIIGESSSGKSMLVNQGLVTKLNKGETTGRAGNQWRVVQTAPFADPLGNLAKSLCHPGNLFTMDREDDRSAVENQLRESSTALTDIYNEALKENDKAFNLLIIVDQKQELFRYQSFLRSGDPKKVFDDVHFINLLLNAHRSTAPIYIVLISDSRYFEYFAKFRGLPEVMNNYRFHVPAITEKEILDSLKPFLPDTDDPNNAEVRFINNLLADFKQISGEGEKADPFALQKLNLCLSMVLHKWRQSDKPQSDPLTFYHTIGNVKSAITYYIEQVVLGAENVKKDRDKKIAQVERLFKALTGNDGNNQFIRRPVKLQELTALMDSEMTMEDISALLRSFNFPSASFLITPNPGKEHPGFIIDINTDSLLSNWPALKAWVEEESTQAIVYKTLVRDALKYYTAPPEQKRGLPDNNTDAIKSEPGWITRMLHLDTRIKHLFERHKRSGQNGTSFLSHIKNLFKDLLGNLNLPAPSDNVQEESVYKGANLNIAKEWKVRCKPNETWAQRYPTTELSEQQKIELSKAFDVVPSHLQLAEKFLVLSDDINKKRLALERGTQTKLENQRKLAFILVGVSIVALIVAGVMGRKVYNEKINIELIDFMNVLGYQGVLNIPESDKYSEMTLLIQSIVKTKSIDSRDKVLYKLNRLNYLSIDTTDSRSDLAFKELRNIDDLYDALKNDQQGKQNDAREEILLTYKETMASYSAKEFKQHPYLYYALIAHVNEATKNNYGESTAIESSAMASCPAKARYAFGDKNGNVYIKKGQLRDTLKNVGGVIKGVSFSGDGNSLFVGTELGRLYRFDSLDLPSGLDLSVQNRLKKDVFSDLKEKKSMYFAKPWPSNQGLVLVCNTYKVFFIKENPKNGKYSVGPEKPLSIHLNRVGCREWFPEENLFFVGGRDTTIVYRLQPENVNKPIDSIGVITHRSNTVLSIALKSEMKDGRKRIWLALGSETGEVWLSKDMDFSKGTIDVNDATFFQSFTDLHEASVSGLKFHPNPRIPQMASASIDGMIRFWNLDKLDDKYCDDIVLRNQGQGISAIGYANDNELAVHQDRYDWVVKTNVESLYKQLDEINTAIILKEKNGSNQ